MPTLDHLIDIALEEDIGPGDITTDALIDPDLSGKGVVFARQDLVVAGLQVARRVFERVDPSLSVRFFCSEGKEIIAGDRVMVVEGRLAGMLTAERTALNFLQRLSGIATHVRRHVRLVEGKRARLVDTRKTTPGWRVLEKYAVRVGGAQNHRMGLFDGILIKDNHIAACGGIAAAVEKARQRAHHLVRIEVEVESIQEVQEALAAGVDVIMLDNMSLEQIQEAVARIAGRATVEISGGVRRDALPRLADTGVDLISVGALTHSAVSVDLSMEITAGTVV
ncbi:MAG: carboxylating nicotinate-nucleotide diphosphorylase [Desulfobacterales bacterium]|nr:carboxylating nicotinate-nucleotide diphosphorylase [Desulfobacterales bacterium]